MAWYNSWFTLKQIYWHTFCNPKAEAKFLYILQFYSSAKLFSFSSLLYHPKQGPHRQGLILQSSILYRFRWWFLPTDVVLLGLLFILWFLLLLMLLLMLGGFLLGQANTVSNIDIQLPSGIKADVCPLARLKSPMIHPPPTCFPRHFILMVLADWTSLIPLPEERRDFLHHYLRTAREVLYPSREELCSEANLQSTLHSVVFLDAQ